MSTHDAPSTLPYWGAKKDIDVEHQAQEYWLHLIALGTGTFSPDKGHEGLVCDAWVMHTMVLLQQLVHCCLRDRLSEHPRNKSGATQALILYAGCGPRPPSRPLWQYQVPGAIMPCQSQLTVQQVNGQRLSPLACCLPPRPGKRSMLHVSLGRCVFFDEYGVRKDT